MHLADHKRKDKITFVDEIQKNSNVEAITDTNTKRKAAKRFCSTLIKIMIQFLVQ